MPPLELPARPHLDWLKNRAKERLAELRRDAPDTQLADAQLDVARAYGFPSWRALKTRVDELRAAAPAGTPEAPAAAPDPNADEAPYDRLLRSFLRAVGTGRIDVVRQALDGAPALVNMVGPHPFWGGRPQALHVAIECGIL